jgi:hypothetical protein
MEHFRLSTHKAKTSIFAVMPINKKSIELTKKTKTELVTPAMVIEYQPKINRSQH